MKSERPSINAARVAKTSVKLRLRQGAIQSCRKRSTKLEHACPPSFPACSWRCTSSGFSRTPKTVTSRAKPHYIAQDRHAADIACRFPALLVRHAIRHQALIGGSQDIFPDQQERQPGQEERHIVRIDQQRRAEQ